MRDIALLAFFIGCIPFMLRSPAIGVIMWVWLGVMNPHRLTYGFAYDLPFAAATATITFLGLLLTKERRNLTLTPPVVALALFTAWMCLASLFPFRDDGGNYLMWSRVMKIMLMTFVALAVIHSKKQIHWLVWAIIVSLGYYGAKGGLFTLITGGNYLVWGPAGSFIEGNNEVALALVMTIPLMRYVQLSLKKRWQKWAMTGVMMLSTFAAIGSHSRGAFVAIAAMAVFLWWKSRNKVGMAFTLIVVGIVVLAFMPAEYFERMNTIKTYDEDSSALGRINAWWMAFNLARDRLMGGGFDIYDQDVFARYAPNPLDIHAAHSIYFQVIGEHGFIGFFLFVSIGMLTWLAASDAKRKAKGVPDLEWVGSLVDMAKVSMIGYAVGGAFLSLAYFDVPYYVMVVIIATRALAKEGRIASTRTTLGPRDLARRDAFGSVPVLDDVPTIRPSPGAEDWRGQGAYRVPLVGFEPGRRAK